jgi:type IV pilus assembly protein PilX
MEERMAGNTRDAGLALQAAEAALRDARRDINGLPVDPKFGRGAPMHGSMFGNAAGDAGSCGPDGGNQQGLCLPAKNPDLTDYMRAPGAILPSVPNHNMLKAPSVAYGQFTGALPIGGTVGLLSNQPRYIVEVFCLQQLGESLERFCTFYRITARGYGRNPNTQVTLQETFLAL